MSDYREQTGSATTWRRASNIVINNQLNQTPSIWFQEDDVAVVGTQQFITRAVSNIHADFDASAVIPLIDPTTGNPTGQNSTQGEFQMILYSLYIQMANARDNPPAVDPTPAPTSTPSSSV